jgi:hypothetical protein
MRLAVLGIVSKGVSLLAMTQPTCSGLRPAFLRASRAALIPMVTGVSPWARAWTIAWTGSWFLVFWMYSLERTEKRR